MEHTASLSWRKSSFSGNGGPDCIEVGQAADGMIHVRDSKDHGRGPVHRYTPAEWQAFILGAKDGEFDLDESGRLP